MWTFSKNMRSEFRALVGYKIDIVTVIIKFVKSSGPIRVHLFFFFNSPICCSVFLDSDSSARQPSRHWVHFGLSSQPAVDLWIRGGCHWMGEGQGQDRREGAKATRSSPARSRTRCGTASLCAACTLALSALEKRLRS